MDKHTYDGIISSLKQQRIEYDVQVFLLFNMNILKQKKKKREILSSSSSNVTVASLSLLLLLLLLC